MKSSVQACYRELVNDHLSPGLRAMGFRGSGGRYSLDQPGCFALLGLQKSAYSDADHVVFTANVLVVLKTAWQRARELHPEFPVRPSASTFFGDGVAQSRIGALSTTGDKWWTVGLDGSVEEIAADFLHDVRRSALPWLRAQIEKFFPAGGVRTN